MRLAEFILTEMDSILEEWDLFGGTLVAGEKLGKKELRDHAQEILHSAAKQMTQTQTPEESSQKSQGHGAESSLSSDVDKASVLHGTGRVTSGFNLFEVVSEYRALRASVLKLWRNSEPSPDIHDLEDITRFNEAIDQSLTAAVGSYTDRVNHSRQMFLAILGHDLRNPLQAIRSSASLLSRPGRVDQDSQWIVSQLSSTVIAMDMMIGDLLDFTGTALGKAPPISPAPLNLKELCQGIILEMQIAHPLSQFIYRSEGELSGVWDGGRLRQMISNLLSNAVQHGEAGNAIELDVVREPSEIVISITNKGEPISKADYSTIFDPLVRTTSMKAKRKPGSIGLGLFIAREVAVSHGGSIEISYSDERGTKFSVHLPLASAEIVGLHA